MKTVIWSLAFVLLAAFCSAPGVVAQATKERPANQETVVQEPATESNGIASANLGGTKNVHQCGSLFLAGQFGKEDIAALKNQKITRVISLRTDGEINWNEEESLKKQGIEFVRVGFRSPETLTDEVFDKVRELLSDPTQTTLLHCGSANRVGGVWLTHRVLDEGIDLETALSEAKQIGLAAPFIQEKAIQYIKRHQSSSEMDGEASVKPGINKGFVSPELDVDAFVKRFEMESREVYLNREKILARCGIEKGDTVADVGAGTGLFTRMFSVEVGDEGWVYAVDISPRFIEHINTESSKHELTNITGVLCVGNSVTLPPNSVDVVFICDTYHHFEYPKSTLASIHRALKEGGHLILIDFDRIEGKTKEWLMGHVRAGKEVFSGEVLDAGFTIVDENNIDGFQENYFIKFRKN